jgi:hypothetical protein
MGSINNRLNKNVRKGNKRVYRLCSEWWNAGFFVLVNENFNAGADLIILRKNGRIVRVIESTNYARKTEFIKDDKFQGYMTNLSFYSNYGKVQKEIVISFNENLSADQWKRCKKDSIIVTVVGHQD